MSNPENKDLYALLLALPQPVFCVREGKVCFCNHAAEEKLVKIGAPLADYFRTEGELYNEMTSETPAQTSVCLAGKSCGVSIHDIDGVRVFIAEQPNIGTVRTDTLLSISRGMENALTGLFASAGTLFPILEDTENEEYQTHMSEMNRAMYQLLRLRCNLVDMYAIMSDEMRLNREKVEIIPYFDNFFYELRHLCLDVGVTLHTTLPKRIFPGWIDKRRVEQAVLMLLSNALKHSPQGGELELRLERMGERIILRLSDHGAGMDDGILATAFARYDRTAELEEGESGVGFGLPIVRRIAQLHGGALMLQPMREGGVSVSMSLCVKAPDETEQVMKSPTAQVDYAGGFRRDLVELSVVLPKETYDSRNVN